jgi:hypothetical protein
MARRWRFVVIILTLAVLGGYALSECAPVAQAQDSSRVHLAFVPLFFGGGVAQAAQAESGTKHCYALSENWWYADVMHKADELGAQCWHNWYAAASFGMMADPRYTPSVHTTGAHMLQSPEYVGWWAASAPGRTWLMLNEPEPEIQKQSPVEAARMMGLWHAAIGTNGRIACCGVTVNPYIHTSWREWLQAYLDAGGMLPDAWHIHIYAGSVAEWRGLYAEWQVWNVAHGNLPTIISETGVGEDVFTYVMALNDPQIEAVYWFLVPEN